MRVIPKATRKPGEGFLRTEGALADDKECDAIIARNLPGTQWREAMSRVLHGIVHGKTIEVTEDLGMSDGQAVDLLAAPSGSLQPPPEGSGSRIDQEATGATARLEARRFRAAGLLAEEWTDEDDRILEGIHAEHKAAEWRELPE